GNDPDETLEALVRRRMGDTFLDYAVDPFILGIYAGDPSKLVTRYALPKLYQLEQKYGSFIKGSIKKARQAKSPEERKVTKQMFSLSVGLDNLTEALYEAIGEENFQFDCRRTTIYPKNGSYSITYARGGESYEIANDTVITTTGAHEIGNLLPFLNKEEKD